MDAKRMLAGLTFATWLAGCGTLSAQRVPEEHEAPMMEPRPIEPMDDEPPRIERIAAGAMRGPRTKATRDDTRTYDAAAYEDEEDDESDDGRPVEVVSLAVVQELTTTRSELRDIQMKFASINDELANIRFKLIASAFGGVCAALGLLLGFVLGRVSGRERRSWSQLKNVNP